MEQPPNSSYNSVKDDINFFVLRSQESDTNDNSQKRSVSKSNRYEFRHNNAVYLPQSGSDPTTHPASVKQPSEGYYYHVTSYNNLLTICQVGLNPDQGGQVGGSSYQNADAEMNKSSAKDSQGKTFCATVTKLTERYLSLRLRQEDLFKKHREFIIFVITSNTTYKTNVAEMMLDRLITGEMPAVLRFKNIWNKKAWDNDPIDKQAFALVGQQVLPGCIECLTIDGWLPLTSLTEMAKIYARKDFEGPLRSGLLTFFGKYNAQMSKMSPEEMYGTLVEALFTELKAAGFK